MRFGATIVCQQLVELASDYLDDQLPPGARRAVDRHLATCEHCTTYLEQLRATIRLARSLRDDQLEPELYDVLRRAWDDIHRRPDE